MNVLLWYVVCVCARAAGAHTLDSVSTQMGRRRSMPITPPARVPVESGAGWGGLGEESSSNHGIVCVTLPVCLSECIIPPPGCDTPPLLPSLLSLLLVPRPSPPSLPHLGDRNLHVLRCQPTLWVCLNACKHLCHHDEQLTRRGQLSQVGGEVLTPYLFEQVSKAHATGLPQVWLCTTSTCCCLGAQRILQRIDAAESGVGGGSVKAVCLSVVVVMCVCLLLEAMPPKPFRCLAPPSPQMCLHHPHALAQPMLHCPVAIIQPCLPRRLLLVQP